MACTVPGRNCFSKRMKELFKKIIIVFIFQLIGWYAYTYMEEGFSLTDCIFDRDNIRRLKTPEEKNTKAELYKNLNESLMGELNETLFRIYHAEFKTFFKAKEPEAKPVDVNAICMKWYLFTAITLTTVGYGNVVPKTVAGKVAIFPYCLIGIPIMLFFLGYIGQMISLLSSAIVKIFYWKKVRSGPYEIPHKELKSFIVVFTLLWAFILLEALTSHYLPEKDENRLSIVDGIYFFFVSFTTIGYGDITSPMDEHFFEFRLYLGLSLMSGVVNAALEFYQKVSERREERSQGRKKCCCVVQHGSGSIDVEPAEEMVIVRSEYFKRNVDEAAKDNNGYDNGDERLAIDKSKAV